MSDIILISKTGLFETIKCTICKNPNQTERGCDGACQYDKELHAKIVEAVIGIAEQRPHGEWIEKCTSFGGKCWAKCSVCNEFADGFGRENGFGHDYFYPKFCPNCGADMRKEGDSDA